MEPAKGQHQCRSQPADDNNLNPVWRWYCGSQLCAEFCEYTTFLFIVLCVHASLIKLLMQSMIDKFNPVVCNSTLESKEPLTQQLPHFWQLKGALNRFTCSVK